jgi:hypothetical protein
MLYVLNQVPDVSASSTGGSPVELATLRDAFALARRQDAEARAAHRCCRLHAPFLQTVVAAGLRGWGAGTWT